MSAYGLWAVGCFLGGRGRRGYVGDGVCCLTLGSLGLYPVKENLLREVPLPLPLRKVWYVHEIKVSMLRFGPFGVWVCRSSS